MFSSHPVELASHYSTQTIKGHYRGACGTFKEGSAALSAGPWGPFTGSTSRDTLLFVKLLEMTQQCQIVHSYMMHFISSIHYEECLRT